MVEGSTYSCGNGEPVYDGVRRADDARSREHDAVREAQRLFDDGLRVENNSKAGGSKLSYPSESS